MLTSESTSWYGQQLWHQMTVAVIYSLTFDVLYFTLTPDNKDRIISLLLITRLINPERPVYQCEYYSAVLIGAE